jgi:hypothetical protein
MSQPNPYQPSELPAEGPRFPPGTLTLGKALGFVLLTMTIFATLGALLGLIIGVVMPQYYTRLFGLSGDGEGMAAGVLLGLMQGGGVGIAVGVLLSAIIAWIQVRMRGSPTR